MQCTHRNILDDRINKTFTIFQGQHISNAQMNNRMLANLLTAVSDLKEAQKVQNRMLVNLLTAVGDVKETQKIHSAMLQSVLKHLTTKNAQSGEQNLPVDIEFPLKSQEEIEQLEAKLADQAIKIALVRFLISQIYNITGLAI